MCEVIVHTISSVGMYRRGSGASAVIVGMEWSAGGPPLLAQAESVEA